MEQRQHSPSQDAGSTAHPRLTETKRGFDSFNIYARVEGGTTWRLLPAKRVRCPAKTKPIARSGTPEERDYQTIGVIADRQIGQPSNIATAIVPG